MPHHEKYDQVQDYHNDMCVTKWAKRLASPKSCVAYLAGMEYQQPNRPDSSLAELEQQCAKMRKTVTVDFIGELCSKSNDAMGDVWQSLHAGNSAAGPDIKGASRGSGSCPHSIEECPHCGSDHGAGGLQQCLRRAKGRSADPLSVSAAPDAQGGRYWNVL